MDGYDMWRDTHVCYWKPSVFLWCGIWAHECSTSPPRKLQLTVKSMLGSHKNTSKWNSVCWEKWTSQQSWWEGKKSTVWKGFKAFQWAFLNFNLITMKENYRRETFFLCLVSMNSGNSSSYLRLSFCHAPSKALPGAPKNSPFFWCCMIS